MSFKSPLKTVKGLGSSHHGTQHWWAQRLTAVALIPLSLWFMVIALRSMQSSEALVMSLQSPMNTVLMIVFLGTVLYHGTLGIQVVIEDYVHNQTQKTVLLVLTQYASILTAVAGIVAVVTFHISHLTVGV